MPPIARFWTRQKTIVIVAAVLLIGYAAQAQRGQQLSPAVIGAGSPLPVFVTNTPVLPDGFVPNSRWRFTTWTAPSVITWVGNVNQVAGPWAHITVNENGLTTSRWYYVAAMPGSWEPQ